MMTRSARTRHGRVVIIAQEFGAGNGRSHSCSSFRKMFAMPSGFRTVEKTSAGANGGLQTLE
jgi:hypothetical protein